MALTYPNIVPDNNLRLPDALTIKHGPAELLARFVLEGDKAVRELGVRLRLRHDFDELLYVNRQYSKNGSWYPLLDCYNPERAELTPNNAFWLSGENEAGEVVVTRAMRIFEWEGTDRERQARLLFYGYDSGQPCSVTPELAKVFAEVICGIVADAGAVWVRPDFRGRHLSFWIPRIGKAMACARWPIDWLVGYIPIEVARKGVALNYGQRHLCHSVQFPGTHFTDIVFSYTSADECYDEMATFLAAGGSVARSEESPSAAPSGLEHTVISTSSDAVFQGSRARS